jgi:hypothetical protein
MMKHNDCRDIRRNRHLDSGPSDERCSDSNNAVLVIGIADTVVHDSGYRCQNIRTPEVAEGADNRQDILKQLIAQVETNGPGAAKGFGECLWHR